MIHLRHILHPIHSVNSLYRRISTYANKRISERSFRSICRGKREQCWCGGPLTTFKWHPNYGTCVECGCYTNRRPPLDKELGRLYSFNLYWHTRQTLKGFPSIENRLTNDRSDGRLDYWLGLIEQHGPSKGRVIEVGCAHGVLLYDLYIRGYDCIGVEPDEQTARWTRENTGLDVRSGFFPDVDLPKCDLFLAFDVIEHSPDPVAFIKGVARSLNPEGVAIIQAPMDRYHDKPPFREMFDKVFDDLEHLFIFTSASFQRLCDMAGLQIILEERWRLAHEVALLRRERPGDD